jgi:alkanesulfonate monooxygenase SsuD/methylene tetrahydromethanopterin reductase-like flavin-dependent oxidoreductase (luciferase family)
MLAVLAPEGIQACAKAGYMVQTTPLQASHAVLMEQVNAFKRGKAEAEQKGLTSRLALMRGVYLARDAEDARRKLELDRLAAYAEAGIDEVILSCNFGQPQAETLEMMERFSAEIMAHLPEVRQKAVA